MPLMTNDQQVLVSSHQHIYGKLKLRPSLDFGASNLQLDILRCPRLASAPTFKLVESHQEACAPLQSTVIAIV